ncbi:ATP-dependent helicase, partial [Listeria monocytogenes]|nr:ATP-dependent helicase [Listeria monocytogenes]
MNDVLDTGDNHIDDHVDEEIKTCFDIDAPKSFFTFAGAGSGKTRSLVNTLKYIDDKYRDYFINHSRRVAVMTYTNAASDEISR